MFCEHCGAQLPGGARFCTSCGAQLSNGAQSAPPPQPAYQQPAYQPPQQPYDQAAPQYARPQNAPWHSRGKLSPLYPRGRRVNILLVLALVALQVVLLFVFYAIIGSEVETDQTIAQAVGLVPTVVLIVYLFCLDTIEKEPPALLLKLFLVEGVLTALVVGYVEIFAESGLELFMDEDSVLFQIIDNLVCVALVEELFKYFVLKRFTWKHPAFNYRFDGIVYAAVTALGFAAFENFFYIMDDGLGVALLRSISAVPGHCVDGILMGIFYGQAKLFEARGDHMKSKRYRVLSILAPIAEHGFYDFFAGIDFSGSGILFHAYVYLLNAVVFVLVWRLAQKDEAIAQPQYAMYQ